GSSARGGVFQRSAEFTWLVWCRVGWLCGVFTQWRQSAPVVCTGVIVRFRQRTGLCIDILVGTPGQPGAGVTLSAWCGLGIAVGDTAANGFAVAVVKCKRSRNSKRLMAAA